MQFFGKILRQILHWGRKAMLIFSSLYFTTLLLITIFVPAYASQIIVVFGFLILFVFLFLISDKTLVEYFSEKYIGLVGSISFLVFVISKYFFETSFFAEVFSLHSEKIQYLLNYSLVLVFIHAAAMIVLCLILAFVPLCFLILLKKLSKNKIYQETVETVFSFLIIPIVFIFVGYNEWAGEFVNDQIENNASLLISLLGFSLLFVHLQFLANRLLEFSGHTVPQQNNSTLKS